MDFKLDVLKLLVCIVTFIVCRDYQSKRKDRNVLINLYLSFIRPILEYGNVIWDNRTQNEANILESVQVEAGRIITGLRVNSSRSKLYSELG